MDFDNQSFYYEGSSSLMDIVNDIKLKSVIIEPFYIRVYLLLEGSEESLDLLNSSDDFLLSNFEYTKDYYLFLKNGYLFYSLLVTELLSYPHFK